MYVCIVCVFLLDLNIWRESGTGYMDNVLLFHDGLNILWVWGLSLALVKMLLERSQN